MDTEAHDILLALSTSMGWSVYGERLKQEARKNPADRVIFHPFTPSHLGRKLSWQPRYADRTVTSLGLLDPFTVAEWQVAATRALCKPYAAAIVATQNLAAGLMRRHPQMPVFIIMDVTRQLYRDAFGATCIGERQVRREGEVLRKARHIFAASNWAARSIMATARIDEDRVSVLPPLSFPCRDKTSIAAHGHGNRLQILFAGLDFHRKGGARLLHWQRTRWAEFADLHIVTRKFHADPACPNTSWYGPVENERLIHEIMPRMDILVHPAYRECCGLVVAEAAGNGVPAIVAAVNGLQETVQHGVTGLVARDEEEFPALVSRLNADRAYLAELARNAKATADERYSADRVYAAIMGVVRRHLRLHD